MKKSIALVLSLLATSLFVACGGSDDKSTAGGAACAAPEGTSDACFSCVKSSCGSQYSALCADDCTANPTSSSCVTASENVGSCAAAHCSSQCNTGSSDTNGEAGSSNATGSEAGSTGSEGGSTGSEAGSTGSDTAGSGGAAAVTDADCKKLEPCCADLTAGPQMACSHIAGLNHGPSCVTTYSLYKCDSVIAAASQPKTSACTSAGQCFMGPYATDAQAAACTQEGGVASLTCPAADATGCCIIGGGIEEMCTYKGYSGDALTESTCADQGGTFSATP